ncbi:hypothetical protein GmHk_14G040191 [Glycine max]|nr:hypothetical protein GmHk_14G040191 [Glycine max]
MRGSNSIKIMQRFLAWKWIRACKGDLGIYLFCLRGVPIQFHVFPVVPCLLGFSELHKPQAETLCLVLLLYFLLFQYFGLFYNFCFSFFQTKYQNGKGYRLFLSDKM